MEYLPDELRLRSTSDIYVLVALILITVWFIYYNRKNILAIFKAILDLIITAALIINIVFLLISKLVAKIYLGLKNRKALKRRSTNSVLAHPKVDYASSPRINRSIDEDAESNRPSRVIQQQPTRIDADQKSFADTLRKQELVDQRVQEELRKQAEQKLQTASDSETLLNNKVAAEKPSVTVTRPTRPVPSRKTTTPYLENSETEIQVIQSKPDPDKNEPKRIGYTPNDNFTQTAPYNYAIVKMPPKNSLIKFPRKGRSNKRGYTEDYFKTYLDLHFSQEFKVFNDRHVPTTSGRPYEPDFVLSNENGEKNIFINIEIDEPYDGWMRTPTHCIGDNDHRDQFFTKRGWLVIRFAEIHIYQNPTECCAYIAQVIKSIDRTYHSDLLTITHKLQLPAWDTLQAKKWAIEKYREGYLGISSFGKRPDAHTEYVIEHSEADEAVEDEVPKPRIRFTNTPSYDQLKKLNGNPRDKRVFFDPAQHRYYIDKNPDTISVTQLIDKFFPEFDAPYWASRKAFERKTTVDAILSEWEAKRDDAASKGTALHEAIERHYDDNTYTSSTKEFEQFLAFKEKYTLSPFRTEWRIFDEDLLVAGTVDMVYKKEDGSLFIFDWKRSEKVVNADGSPKKGYYDTAFGELSHIGDNSYYKYCLQQNIYKSILEKRYKQKISSMNLLVMHEAYDRYHILQIPDMQSEVGYIFRYALQLK